MSLFVARCCKYFQPLRSMMIQENLTSFPFCFSKIPRTNLFQYQFLLWSIDFILFLIQLPCESLWIASPAITARPLPCQPRPGRRPGSPSQLLCEKLGYNWHYSNILFKYIYIYIYDGWYKFVYHYYMDILSRLYGIIYIYIYNFYNSWFVKRV